MNEEVLSQNQVEGLLRAMEAVAPGLEPQTPGPRSDSTSAIAPLSPRSHPARRLRTVAYDFKRPERVGKEPMRAVQALHESMARSLGAGLSSMLRTMVEAKLVSVDQLTYSEFIYSLNNPSCFCVVRAQPLEGNWVLDIEPTMAYALIDRMLGGDPEPGDTIKRPLTEIESRLINRAIRLYLQQLQDVWENVLPVEFAVERIESNPQLVQIVSPNEVIILVGMELTMGKIRGMLNLCIPFTTIERYAPQLSNTSWAGGSRNRATEESQRTVGRRLEAAEVEVIVTLARSRIRTADLLSLSPGDIITTEQDVDSPLQVSVANVPKFDARAGAYRGKKAICISGQTNPPPAGPSSS